MSSPHTSNTDLLPDRGPQITVVAILFLALTWISVITRCSVRIFMNRLFRIDDWLAICTLLSFTVFCFFVLVGVVYGTGRKNGAVSDPSYRESLKWWYGGELTYSITTCLLKVSIGSSLLQICIYKSQKRIIWGLIIIFSTYSVFYVFIMAFQCHPVSFFWRHYANKDPPITTEGACNHQNAVVAATYTHGVLSAIVDWTLGTLPIFLVWNLQMNTRTKISVVLILALGAIGSVATIIRMPYISKLAAATDFLYENTGVSIWSTVEPGMGITASSMACMRPLFSSCLNASRNLKSDRRIHGSHWAVPVNVSSQRNIYSNIDKLHLDNVSSKANSKPSAESIMITTVVKTGSARKSSLDLESGIVVTKKNMTQGWQ